MHIHPSGSSQPNGTAAFVAMGTAVPCTHLPVWDRLADYLDSGEGIATTCLIDDGLHLSADCLDRAAAALEADLPAPARP